MRCKTLQPHGEKPIQTVTMRKRAQDAIFTDQRVRTDGQHAARVVDPKCRLPLQECGQHLLILRRAERAGGIDQCSSRADVGGQVLQESLLTTRR